MKLIIFALVFLILAALASLAQGLEITEISVDVDYDDSYTYKMENRDRISSADVPAANNSKINAEVLPGSKVTFTVRVANTFNGDKPVIKGAFASITIEDVDAGSDLDEESTDIDLSPGDDYRFDLKFGIPVDADAGTYNVQMKAEGEDKNGTLYQTELKLKLEVRKMGHDIRITKVFLNPGIVDCSRKTKLTAEITNAGSNAENDVALEFKSGIIGINSADRGISLGSSDDSSDEEKKYAKTLSIDVPLSLKPGTYPVSVNLYWKSFVLFDQKTADLVVRDCASGTAKAEAKEDASKGKEDVAIILPKEDKKAGSNEPIISTEEISILNSPMLLSMLLGAFVAAVLAVFVVIGYLRKGKERV